MGSAFRQGSFVFGRSTPFSGQGIGATVSRYTIIYKGDATAINSNDTEGIGGYTLSNTAVSSVTDAIKTPNTYYYNSSGAWHGVDISLWSDYGTNKSIYDPCPYGYRVPKSGESTASSWYGFPATTWTPNTIEGGAAWSNTWWPATGLRYNNSGTIGAVGNNGWYWSSTRHSSAYQSYYLHFNFVGAVNPSNADGRSGAYSVRCVQERGRALLLPPWDMERGTWELWCDVHCWDPSTSSGSSDE